MHAIIFTLRKYSDALLKLIKELDTHPIKNYLNLIEKYNYVP